MKTFHKLAIILLFATFARADLYVKNGTYTGDGNATQAITGVGFAPVVVIAGCNDTSETYAKTDAYTGSNSKPLDATAEDANGITTLGADGFTVATALNATSVACKYLALGGTDVDAIEYTGTGSAHSETGFSFGGSTPSFVWILPSSAQARITVVFSSLDAEACLFNTSQCASTVTVQGLEANGFSVDTNVTVNQSGQTYEAFGIVAAAAHFELSSYVGNGADDTNITTGLTACNGVIVADQTAARQWRANFTNEDLTVPLFGGAFAADIIQGFSGANFQVGTSTQSNASGETYYYFAFEDNAPAGACTPTHLSYSTNYDALAVQYVDTVWPEVRVEIRDAAEAVCTAETGDVVVSKATGAGTLGGTLTVAAVAGVASFTDLTHDTNEAMTIDVDSGALTGIAGDAVQVNATCTDCVWAGDNCPNFAGALCFAPTDLDIRADVTLTDWTPAADMAVQCQESSWCLYVATDGLLGIWWTTNGIDSNTCESTAAPTTPTRLQIRATLDVNAGAADKDCNFYTRTDEAIGSSVGWTQLGTTVNSATATSINDSAEIMIIGKDAEGTYADFVGTYHQGSWFDAIAGSEVADPDFRDGDQNNGDGTWTDTAGANVWTVNGVGIIPGISSPQRLQWLIGHRRRKRP